MPSPTSDGLDFLVRRDDWHQHRFEETGAPADLAPGRVRFRVDRFALTANNISYAKAGDMLRYWDFFPAKDGWGRIPVMGYGDVVQSSHPDVAEGQRCFGFFPMSRDLVIEPSSAKGNDIVDGAPHREGIAPVYNTYSRVDGDALYSAEHEDETMLMRGLFMTSFLADDMIQEEGRFGASSVIVGSASSKTGIALAHLLAEAGDVTVVGLTSPRNAAFVKGLGYYDEVVLYDDVESIPNAASVFVDMAGNGDITNRLHRRLGENMKYSCRVGATHWDAEDLATDLPGAKPEFFFAPGQIQKRVKEWGPGGFQQRIGASWSRFRDASRSWLEVIRGQGREDLEKTYTDTLEGRTHPNQGHVLSLKGEG
jgi:NADPH:quinone reductase-like Zn-dependent oxidoreductase